MSRLFRFILTFGMFASLLLPGVINTQGSTSNQAAAAGLTGMPGFPIPAKPVPHHQPGQPARGTDASTSVIQVDSTGQPETVKLTGIDAELADGTLSDPLAGNYNLMGKDEFLFSDYDTSNAASPIFYTATYGPNGSSISLLPGTGVDPHSNVRFATTAAGDLNGDGVDEQIMALINPANLHVIMSVSDLASVASKTTSAPAAVAYPDGTLDVFVRGRDYALWSLNYDGSKWDTSWSNAAGGLLVSAPAVVSRAAGELDAFAIGMNNQVYRQHKGSGGWEGWNVVQSSATFPALASSDFLLSVPAPAVVARGAQLDLFRLGPGGILWWTHSDDGSSWTNWQSLGNSMLASMPGAVSLGSGKMQVYALGADGAPWYRTYDGSAWGGWQHLAFGGTAAWNAVPVLFSPAANQVTLYLAGKDNFIWKNAFNGTAWQGWSSSAAPAGKLDKGIAAGYVTAGTFLFAQMADGNLQYCLDAVTCTWAPLPGLGSSLVAFDTGAVTAALPANDTLENQMIDLNTGYLTGDGRKQVILTYKGADGNIHLEVYDVKDGFKLQKIAELSPTVAAISPKVAAGDVDGDFLDEIGLAAVVDPPSGAPRKVLLWVERPAKDEKSGAWTGALTQVSYSEDVIENSTGDIWHGWLFEGTLRIAAGDIAPEDNSNNDEFAIMANWRHDASGSYRAIAVTLDIYDQQASTKLSRKLRQEIQAGDTWYWTTQYATGFGLAVGDVNGAQPGYGNDEVVLTYPTGFEGNDYPDVQRTIRVYGMAKGSADLTKLAESALLSNYARVSYLDCLAVGDTDGDLKDEIILAGDLGNGSSTGPFTLAIYDFENLAGGPTNHWEYSLGNRPLEWKLVAGNFTGEGIRVGPPSYRTQRGMISPQVFLNMPPMHRDIIDGHGEINIYTGAVSTYTASTTTNGETSTDSKRDWSISTGIEMSVGAAGSTVDTSLKNTYGENFSTSTDQIKTEKFTSTSEAQYFDWVIYNATNYGIWEYPVYGVQADDPNQPTTIAVVFPLVTASTTNKPTPLPGIVCDENFYAPSHQPFNVWSYNAIDSPDFADYYADGKVEIVPTNSGQTIEVSMASTTSEKRTKGFTNQISAGLSYSYKNELNIPLVGSAWDFSFRVSTEANYGIEQTSTLTNTFTDETTVKVDYPATRDSGIYSIKSFLYWAKAGYLVLDYQTQPWDNTGAWSFYDKPDPAFILPWYGFPDPVTGVFPPLPSPDAPPCGMDKQLFTHDITISPAVAENGDQVTLKATVRNFSDVLPPQDISNVTVRFYLGAPAGNSNQIGSCSVTRASLNRLNGPASCSTNWTVSGGSGEEKIYAVIDPDNAFPEMHEAGSKINNNTGYGLLNVASANYFDPGLANQQAYQGITYATAPVVSAAGSNGVATSSGVQFGLYVPTGDQAESIRYEIVPTEISGLPHMVGVPFQLLAYRGGDKNPVDSYTFVDSHNLPNPAVVEVTFADSNLPSGAQKSQLKLYRQKGSTWVEATCPGYSIQRFPADTSGNNIIAIPVCQAGTFILSDLKFFYLPAVKK